MSEPTKIPVPFANEGDRNDIPESDADTGYATWSEGFGAINSVALQNGGVAPKRLDFNGIFYMISAAVVWLQQGGVYEYDSEISYEAGNVVLGSDGALYFCLADVTGEDPADGGDSWRCIITAEGKISADEAEQSEESTKLISARNLQVDLTKSGSVSFDGSADVDLGVTGVLGEENGGTGATSLSNVSVGHATKADAAAVHTEITIPADGWTEADDGYYTDIEVSDATADTVPVVSVLPDYLETAYDCGLSPAVQSMDGAVRFYADYEPEEDMTADLTLIGTYDAEETESEE